MASVDRAEGTQRAATQLPNPNALALCRDVVLVAHGVAEPLAGKRERFTEWRLLAIDRETGREAWRVVLPVEPVFDGISIDRAGRILVAGADGSVICYGKRPNCRPTPSDSR
jgi:outer membrane protein assembly factor BamB